MNSSRQKLLILKDHPREAFLHAQAEPTEGVQRSLASLREVSAIVDAKAPDEAAAFKAWLRRRSCRGGVFSWLWWCSSKRR
jgi:hypothetical protein